MGREEGPTAPSPLYVKGLFILKPNPFNLEMQNSLSGKKYCQKLSTPFPQRKKIIELTNQFIADLL